MNEAKTTRRGRGLALALVLATFVACKAGTVYDGDGTCFAPDQCLDRCGGRVVESGVCGSCPAGTVSSRECRIELDATAPNCATTPCVRAIQCVSACGGAVVQSGCCPCPAGTFDDLVCKDAGADASADAGASGDASDASGDAADARTD